MSKKWTTEDVKDYLEHLTKEQVQLIVNHCNDYGIKPVLCAWYEDMDDFYSDWCDEVGYSQAEADRLFEEGTQSGEFKQFSDDSIVRFNI